MPITEWAIPDHLIAEWNDFGDDGETIMKSVTPEDAIQLMAKGYTIQEMINHFGCISDCIEHVVASIPEMMVYKSQLKPQESGAGRKLPRINKDT